MNRLKFLRERLPDAVSFLFFIGVWISLSFWLRLWLIPGVPSEPTFTVAEQNIPPISSAANLFGGSQQASALASVQLNGVIRSTRPQESVVIIAAEGGPPRALRLHAEVMPGIVVKEINSRSVILSGKGAERELALPAFAAQSGTLSPAAGVAGQQSATLYRQPPEPSQMSTLPPPSAPVASSGASSGASSLATNASGSTSAGGVAQNNVAPYSPTATVPVQEPQIVLPSETNRR
jgi:general secretion pathway protein C